MRGFLMVTVVALTTIMISAGAVFAQVCELDELGSVSTPGVLSVPVIFNNVAYVAAGSAGLVSVDIGDPSDLALIGSTSTGGQAFDIALDYFGERLLVANGSAGVGIYAIDSGGVLSEAGMTGVGETVISLAGSSGRFLAGSQEGTLYSMNADAGDAPPTAEGSVVVGGQVRGIVEASRYAYCALGSGGLAMVSVTDPAAMEVVDSLDLGGTVFSVARVGDMLYCGVEGVGLVSVTVQGTTLAQAGSLTLPSAATRIVVWLGRAFMAGPDLGVAEADITLPGDPILLTRLELDGADGLALVGNTLYVGRGAQGLVTLDASSCANAGVDPTTSFIPAAAKAPGGFGSLWLTDAAFTNLTNATASFNLSYLVKAQENTNPLNVSLVLEPGEQLLAADVFESIFGLPEANGALRITASHPDVKITSRTYNAAGVEGTYGQFIPAFTRDDALEAGEIGALLQLQQNPGFRSNIGLLNVQPESVEVDIELYRGTGNLVGVVNETLLPYEMTQIDQIYALVGAGRVDSGYALVKVLTGGGRVLAYASVADNGSGDAIYVSAQKLSTGTSYGQ